MKILKSLNSNYLSILLIIFLLSFDARAEDEPIDIWNIDRNKIEETKLTTNSENNQNEGDGAKPVNAASIADGENSFDDSDSVNSDLQLNDMDCNNVKLSQLTVMNNNTITDSVNQISCKPHRTKFKTISERETINTDANINTGTDDTDDSVGSGVDVCVWSLCVGLLFVLVFWYPLSLVYFCGVRFCCYGGTHPCSVVFVYFSLVSPGQFSRNLADVCTPCSPGTHQPSSSSSSCLDCTGAKEYTSGTYNSSTNPYTECKECGGAEVRRCFVHWAMGTVGFD